MDAVTLQPSPPAPSPRVLWKLPWLTPGVCRLIFLGLLAFGFFSHVRYLAHDCPIDLSGDEAHYWDWSRQLDWSYYSKGPLVAYIIRASCAAFGRDTMFAVRFPSLLLAGGTSILTYLLTLKLFRSDRLALGTVLLYHVVPMFVAGSVLMTIDPPFFFCWALATYLAAFAALDGRRWAWPAVGMVAGIGFLAKYAMLLWYVPLLLFLLTDSRARRWLRSPWPWVALGISLLALVPVAEWNARHHWVSFHHVATQTGTSSAGHFRLANVAEFVGGQVGVVGPGLFVIMAAGAIYAARPWGRGAGGGEPRRRELRFLMWFGVAFFAFTLLASFRTKVQLNWPAPAYFTLMIAAAYFLATRLQDRETWKAWRWWFYPAVVFGLLMMPIAHDVEVLYPAVRWVNTHAAAWRQEKHGFFAWLGRRIGKDGVTARQVDFTMKLKGWRELGDRLSDELDTLGPGAFILCDDYQQTAETAFYTRGQPKTFYMGSYYSDDPKRQTQYDVWPDRTLEPPNERIGRNAIYVCHTDQVIPDLAAAFERVEGVTKMMSRVVDGRPVLRPEQRAITLDLTRNGVPLRTFRYFKCYGFKGIARPAKKTSF